MARYERSTVVRAPFEDVWAFHSTVDALEELTPGWLGLTVVGQRGPDGEPDDGVLAVGVEVDLELRPFGLGPPQSITSRITARTRSAAGGAFTDEMVEGPFERWRHTHRFAAVDGGTRLTDHVEYALPLGPARSLSAVAWPGFEATFAYRHRRTRRLLE